MNIVQRMQELRHIINTSKDYYEISRAVSSLNILGYHYMGPLLALAAATIEQGIVPETGDPEKDQAVLRAIERLRDIA